MPQSMCEPQWRPPILGDDPWTRDLYWESTGGRRPANPFTGQPPPPLRSPLLPRFPRGPRSGEVLSVQLLHLLEELGRGLVGAEALDGDAGGLPDVQPQGPMQGDLQDDRVGLFWPHVR